MNLAGYPRRHYVTEPTPIERLSHLSELLGGPTVFMKRDDLLQTLTAGGNKVRKLDFVVADALEKGADTLITCGAVQSNHCRLTLAAAVKEGLHCRLVLEERVPDSYSVDAGGNNFLFNLLGAEKMHVVPGGSDMAAEMRKVANDAIAEGRKPYVIPGGASNELGATGYAACVQEILKQSFDRSLSIDAVVCASGSGGTHAGLLAGLHGSNSPIPVIGINVSTGKEAQEEKIFTLANKTCAHLGLGKIPRRMVTCYDDYVGPGYSLPTAGMIEAVHLLAKTEGILLDPVYTGKAMAGLIDLIRKRTFKKEDTVLFIHTGGAPGLFACTSIIMSSQG